jgi:asparagine synthase (glutamine-hydrolysing)
MNDSQSRRGPDDAGVHSWSEATLGHRRLSIFDLSNAGHQPMVSPNGQVGVVFNGAIYNFRELRTELERAGYRFRSRTDTEVIVHGYAEWGVVELAKRLHGMFAIAIYDATTETLHLVRDRIGVKPLVYVERDGGIWFASTARALRVADVVSEVDPLGMIAILATGYLADDESIYRGLRKLPAGCRLEWRDGRASIFRYWGPRPAGSNRMSFAEAEEETERRLRAAARMRTFADVPVAVLLSAGVDSALVSWAVAESGAKVAAYTVGVPGDHRDESGPARATAERLGLEHHVLPMTSVDFDDLDQLTNAFSEPFPIESALGMLHVAETIRSAAKVVLTGDGGDDVFLGYPRHRHLWLASVLRGLLPDATASAWRSVRDRMPQGSLARRASAVGDYTVDGMRAYRLALDRSGWLAEKGILTDELGKARRLRRGAVPQDRGADLLGSYLGHAYHSQLVGEYLPKVDGATMFHGLEARSPLLDSSLWELASSLSYGVRLHRGEPKAILRSIARRRLGPAVADREKTGFRVPVARWMTQDWRARVSELIAESALARDGWVDGDRWQRVHLDFAPGSEQPIVLWRLLVLEKWYRREAA